MTVGEKIKNHLDKNGITQVELSINTGITTPKINLMLTGKRRLHIEEYEVICYALKVPIGTFLEAKKPEFLQNH